MPRKHEPEESFDGAFMVDETPPSSPGWKPRPADVPSPFAAPPPVVEPKPAAGLKPWEAAQAGDMTWAQQMAGMRIPSVTDVTNTTQTPAPPEEEHAMHNDPNAPIIRERDGKRYENVEALQASLAEDGTTLHKNAIYGYLRRSEEIEGDVYRYATDVDQVPAAAVGEQPAAPSTPSGDAVERPSSPADGEDFGSSSDEPEQSGVFIGPAPSSELIVADHRGRVRITVVECDDCAPDTIGQVVAQLADLFRRDA